MGYAGILRELAGIKPNAPGYKSFSVKPFIDHSIDYVHAQIHTPYGKITVTIKNKHGIQAMNLTVPAGTQATVAFGDVNRDFPSGTHIITSYSQSSSLYD